MINSIPLLTIRFIVLVLLQVLILNNVAFNGYVNPYLYILFVLMLPFETPKWLVLFLGFALGFSVDIFSSTLGMHLGATLFMAYAREYVLRLIAPRGGYDPVHKPSIKDMGIAWFTTYVSILTILHHLFLFTIEVFRFSEFFSTMGRSLLSSLFTLMLIFIIQPIILRKK